MATGRRKLSGVSGGSATRVTGAEAGAACAATELVRIAVTIVMVAKAETVKQIRRRVSRTLLSGPAQTEQYRLRLDLVNMSNDLHR